MFFSILIVIFLIYSSFDIGSPLSDAHPGFIAGQYSEYAINYIKFGYLKTKLAQLWNTGGLETGKEVYENYVHRPIGTALLLSLSFRVFGVSEWSARIIQIIANLGSVLFLYLIVKNIFNRKIALITCFFLVFSPMFFYMRNFISPDALIIFFIFATLYFYILWLKHSKSLHLYLLFITFSLGAFIEWSINFIVPVILIHYFILHRPKHKERRKNCLMILILLSFITFSINVLHIWLVSGIKGLSDLYFIFLFRANLNEASWGYNISLVGLLNHLYRDISYFYTPLLFVVLLIFVGKTIIKKTFYNWDGLFLLVLASFLSYLFVFSNLYWIHDFLILFILPGIFLATASFFETLEKCVKRKVFYLILFIFMFSFLYYSYPTIKKIYEGNSNVSELIIFLAQNPGDIIISFNEHPQNFQLKFYLQGRKIYYARDIETFKKIVEKENVKFFIEKNEEPLDQEFENYLVNNFQHTILGKYVIFILTK
ncbi:MAG: glycosyltransferase family 39 protein [Candidatus Aenigmatarchaeota archaeon]